MEINFGHEKIRQAIGEMASNPADLPERLAAVIEDIDQPKVLTQPPPEFAKNFREILHHAHAFARQAPSQSLSEAVKANMTKEEARSIIDALDLLETMMGIRKS